MYLNTFIIYYTVIKDLVLLLLIIKYVPFYVHSFIFKNNNYKLLPTCQHDSTYIIFYIRGIINFVINTVKKLNTWQFVFIDKRNDFIRHNFFKKIYLQNLLWSQTMRELFIRGSRSVINFELECFWTIRLQTHTFVNFHDLCILNFCDAYGWCRLVFLFYRRIT